MSRGLRAVVPNVAILSSAVLWGTLWIPLRRMHEADPSGRVAATAGFVLPLLLLLPFALRRWRSLLRGGRALGMVGFCLASSIALYAEGLVRGEVARVILLFYLTSVWSTLLGRFALGEPITPQRVATIALGLTGMGVIFGREAGSAFAAGIAEWMGLAAGISWAVAMVYIRRTASRPSWDRVFVQFVFLGPVFFLLTLVPGREAGDALAPWALVHVSPWWVAFALVWMLPVIWLTVFGASRLDPGRVAICLMAEIVVGLTTAALLTDERLGPREMVGAILILGSVGAEVIGLRPRSSRIRESDPLSPDR